MITRSEVVKLGWSAAVASVAFAYGGGGWLHYEHEVRGVHEIAELPPVWHWLRDSTLAWPVVFMAVWLAMLIGQPFGRRLRPLQGRVALVILLGCFSTAAFTVGVPVHGYLFPAEHHSHGAAAANLPPDEDSDIIQHALSDGLSALPVNLAIAVAVNLLSIAAASQAARAQMIRRRIALWLEQPVLVIRPIAVRPPKFGLWRHRRQ